MTLIYRVQHPKNGKGPFHNSHANEFCNYYNDTRSSKYEWAGPYVDHKKYYDKYGPEFIHGYMFGVQSIDLIEYWFPNHMVPALVEFGYIIACYEVSPKFVRTGKSKKQVIFRKDKAKLVAKYGIDELYSTLG